MTFIKHNVISVQSHVVQGYVGNSAVVFSLQLLGHKVEAIHTVQYSSAFTRVGNKVNAEDLGAILDQLPVAWDASERPYLVCGYMSDPGSLFHLKRFYHEHIKYSNIDNRYRWICDPVLGDNQKLYVAPSMVQAYRDFVIPYADILTPNQFELELLCNKKVDSLRSACACCKTLHENGTRAVVVTSLRNCSENPKNLVLLGSTALSPNLNDIEVFTFEFPYINTYMAGTGDLFTAFLVHGLDRFKQNIKKASFFALEATQVIINETLQRSPIAKTIDVFGAADIILGFRDPPLLSKTAKHSFVDYSCGTTFFDHVTHNS